MIVDLSTRLDCAASTAIEHVTTSRLLEYVAKPLVTFVPKQPNQLPDVWRDGTYWVELRLFGVIPVGKQAIVISHPQQHPFTLRDNGHSPLIKRWDHTIEVAVEGTSTRYRDHVVVEAGWLTPLIWLFAQVFYRHRQRRWRRLAARHFRYE
ncbi:MAG: hypothetical protein LCH85_07385 [Chloroflexi bacterium]|nr:hypothetical protein [Chloroflexota bacterium]